MFLNCGAGKDSLESFGLYWDLTSQSWIFVGRAEAEAPVIWPLDEKNWLTGKDSDAGEDWRQEEKGATEDEMIG